MLVCPACLGKTLSPRDLLITGRCERECHLSPIPPPPQFCVGWVFRTLCWDLQPCGMLYTGGRESGFGEVPSLRFGSGLWHAGCCAHGNALLYIRGGSR